MRIFVKAKAGARENKVEAPAMGLFDAGEKTDECYTVFVKELPEKGKANDAIAKLLAEYFNTSSSQVRLVSGASSKRKVYQIPDIVNL